MKAKIKITYYVQEHNKYVFEGSEVEITGAEVSNGYIPIRYVADDGTYNTIIPIKCLGEVVE